MANTRPRWPVWIVIGSALCCLALVSALHRLRPDVDPVRDDLSIYAVGPFANLMAAAFILLGTSVFATATLLAPTGAGNRTVRVNRSVLAISGIAGALVAAFPTAAMTPETPIDYAELVASLVFFVGFGTSSLVLSLAAWTGSRRRVASFLSGAFAVLFLCLVFGPEEVHGLLMRIALGFIVSWLIVTASWWE